MSRISERLLPNKQGFIPFLTAGDPDLDSTLELAITLGESCADVLELGVPFSDPVADGPVIQRSSLRALGQHTSLAKILELVKRMRLRTNVPVVLFSYFNPILQFGLERAASAARDAGVDGFLLTDLPPEESGPYLQIMRKYELDTIFLAAPTTTADRLRKIVSVSSGFIYMISRAGVTGERDSLPGDVEGKVRELKHESRLPVAVGFGISRPEHVQQVWQIADAAVVGSALVHRIEECAGKQGWIDQVLAYANWLKGANNRSTDG